MQKHAGENEFDQMLDQALGYLNFSIGSEDKAFLASLNFVFAELESREFVSTSETKSKSPRRNTDRPPLYQQVADALRHRLICLKESNSTFADSNQATRVLDLVFDHVVPGYFQNHQELYFHRSPDNTFNAFFVGRICEAVLSSKPLELDANGMLKAVAAKLNDYIGHRPVPALESQKVEPYPGEWIRPIPIFVKGVGVAHGKYRQILEGALQILEKTDSGILDIAQFSIDQLEEVAIDPRAYDFDHPINRRPNFHFGQWSEQQISNDGYFNRFIVHEVTLDSLLERVETEKDVPRDELMVEAAAALAGTILMAAGISGRGPGAYESEMSLSDLLPRIAQYRDEFYEFVLQLMSPQHRQRIDRESETRHQSFGAVRQHLNNHLSSVRSVQMVRTHLAMIFARMGYDSAAEKQADVIPVASSRFLCKIDCLLSRGNNALQRNQLDIAAETVPAIMETLRRGIHCGALVDPWNILGFDANYSLFPNAENSVRDHRVDELVDLMGIVVAFCSRVWIAAAAESSSPICEQISAEFEQVTDWWRQFAAHEIESVESIDPAEIFRATRNVANAIQLAQKDLEDPESTSAIGFWAKHAELFQSPRAFSLTVDAMIDRGDFSTSMGLLIYWLSEAERIPLEHGDSSFCGLVSKWMQCQTSKAETKSDSDSTDESTFEQQIQTWDRFRKFHDYLEANAERYWDVPRFDLNRNRKTNESDERDELGELENEDDDLYGAAYEDVVYIDTTDDGIDSSLDDIGGEDDVSESLRLEAQRISDRLSFLEISADLFKVASTMIPLERILQMDDASREQLVKRQMDSAESWLKRTTEVSTRLDELTENVESYRLAAPRNDYHSIVEFDRQRHYKESLIDQLITVNVEYANGCQMLSGWLSALRRLDAENDAPTYESELGDQSLTNLFGAILGADRSKLGQVIDEALHDLGEKPILYVPLNKGGKSHEIRSVRSRQCAMGELLDCLPRLGCFKESYELTQLVLMMERNQKTRSGAVTEFDELFRISYTSMIETLVESARQLEDTLVEQDKDPKEARETAETALFECMEMLTESMLMIWLSHSHTLRLSVLEKIPDQPSWERLKEFIREYGTNLLTQTFLNLTNVRSILHQGVDHWLSQVVEEPDSEELPLIRDLDTMVSRKLAVKNLTLILELVIENFTEYRDYNSTTTQSDHGELLYVLIEFLRLRCKYDRVSWRLKPVIWAHETLVRNEQSNVARMWRRSLTERVGSEAERFVEEYEELRKEHSIQMATVLDRLNEKFVHPMQVDRLCSLVESAMSDPQSQHSQSIFDLIEHQADTMAAGSNGPGIDVPQWISSLSDEVERVAAKLNGGFSQPKPLVQSKPIPLAKIREQIELLPRRSNSQ